MLASLEYKLPSLHAPTLDVHEEEASQKIKLSKMVVNAKVR